LLRSLDVDLRYHAALPNLLVGAGLLFTFLGLAAALSIAGGVVSGTSNERNEALRMLLEAASFKFLTSLTGLALSLAYALSRAKERASGAVSIRRRARSRRWDSLSVCLHKDRLEHAAQTTRPPTTPNTVSGFEMTGATSGITFPIDDPHVAPGAVAELGAEGTQC
jgi:hypothetical protein